MRYSYADFLGEVGEHDEAIAQARTNSDRAPRSPFYLTALGMRLRDAGKVEESIKVFEEALAIDPTRVGTLSQLARSYLEISATPRPSRRSKKAIQYDPEPAALRFAILAETYAKVGNKDRAKEMLVKLEAVAKKGEEYVPPDNIKRIQKALAQ